MAASQGPGRPPGRKRSGPALLPPWLAALAAKARPEQPARHAATPATRNPGAYVRAAIDAERRAVVNAPTGQRNDQLNRSAWALARFVRDGQLAAEVMARELMSAAGWAGLTAAEARRTIGSALKSRHT